MKYTFGDIVIVEGWMIGVIVKCWSKSNKVNEPQYDVYVRNENSIREFVPESEIERYMVRHKELSEEERTYQDNAVHGW